VQTFVASSVMCSSDGLASPGKSLGQIGKGSRPSTYSFHLPDPTIERGKSSFQGVSGRLTFRETRRPFLGVPCGKVNTIHEGVNVNLTSSFLISSSLTTSGFGVIVVRLRFVRDLLVAQLDNTVAV